MMATKKKRFAIGDRCWRVEWVSKLAFYDDDPNGDIDRDACTTSTRCFRMHEEARAFAEKIWPETCDKFGIVEVDELEYRSIGDDQFPWLAEWECVNEWSEIFSGEWEN